MALSNLKAPFNKKQWDSIKNYIESFVNLASQQLTSIIVTLANNLNNLSIVVDNKIDKVDVTNAATGLDSVGINAKSGVATFTKAIQRETVEMFTIQSSFVGSNSVVVNYQLKYDNDNSLGIPAIVSYFIDSDFIRFYVYNISTSDSTNSNLIIEFNIVS